MQRKRLLLMSILLFAALLNAQGLPTLGEYLTLKCDLHTHTIFSDGLVWPSVRIDEAVNEGLDAIVISDHLEYRPHREYVSADLNAAYEIARQYAEKKNKDVICIAGAEITRRMPPGHLNAIFIRDANALLIDDFLQVVEEAIAQGAFVFWNHPGWRAQQRDGVVRWYDVHTTLIERNWLHGIEFANEHEHYPGVLEYTEKYGLAVLGCSDIHYTIKDDFLDDFSHRTMTLVFATERSEKAIKEALFAGRTLAWTHDDILAGPAEITEAFVRACLQISPKAMQRTEIVNLSEIPFVLSDAKNRTHHLPAAGKLVLRGRDNILTVKNVHIGKNEYLKLSLTP
jgi:hypothetical protein